MNYYNTYLTRWLFIWRYLSFVERCSFVHPDFIYSLEESSYPLEDVIT